MIDVSMLLAINIKPLINYDKKEVKYEITHVEHDTSYEIISNNEFIKRASVKGGLPYTDGYYDEAGTVIYIHGSLRYALEDRGNYFTNQKKVSDFIKYLNKETKILNKLLDHVVVVTIEDNLI